MAIPGNYTGDSEVILYLSEDTNRVEYFEDT